MNPNTKFIICGDININCLVDTDRKSPSHYPFCNVFDTVDFPTITQNTKISAIDNICLDFLNKETL
jgi:hypothetical protein